MPREASKIFNALALLLLGYLLLPVNTQSHTSEGDPTLPTSSMNPVEEETSTQTPPKNGVFYYFGFGSNMLAKRIHLQNPTAVFVGPALLKNYRLDFNVPSETWRGAAATIVPTKDAIVYGTVWEIDYSNLESLDLQEGVPSGVYLPVHVPVKTLNDGKMIECRAYHLTQQPDTDLRTFKPETTPLERQPSKSYLKTIVKGAIETGLPEDYINWLRSVKHNGNIVEKFEHLLELGDVPLNI